MGFSTHASFAFATGTCVCTTSDADCRPVFLSNTQQTSNDCKETCIKNVGKTFTTHNFAYGTEGEILASTCQQKHNAFLASKTSSPSGTSATTIAPNLNVPIPGLTFSEAITTSTSVKSSFLADYLSAVYKFLIFASITIAIVMVMVGGLQYTMAASGGDVSKGKTRIINALSGLVLLLGVYLILYTTNPQLTLMKPIELQSISKVEMTEFSGDSEDDGSDTTNLPPAGEIYCPHSGGSSSVQQIVNSLKGRVLYRWGGKWNMNGPYGLSSFKIKIAKDPTAKGYAAWSKVLALSQQKCPEGYKCLDCSGFVSAVLSCAGVKVSGGSVGLLNSGRKNLKDNPIDFKNAIVDGVPFKPGDIIGWTKDDAAFTNDDMPGHVLIYVGKMLNGKHAIAESTGGKNGVGYSPGLNANLRPFTEAEIKHLLPGDMYYRYRRIN